ncbi:hypothetical protein D3C78_1077110 [compost metagenome]
MQAQAEHGGIRGLDVRQQQALPRGQPQAGVTERFGQTRRAFEHGRVKTPQRRDSPHIDLTVLALWISADRRTGIRQGTLPAAERSQGHTRGQGQQERLLRMLVQQMTHAGLIRAGELKKQLQHRHHQGMPIAQQHSPGGRV